MLNLKSETAQQLGDVIVIMYMLLMGQVNCHPKISSKDLEDFEREFNHKPYLKEVSFEEYGENEYKYEQA